MSNARSLTSALGGKWLGSYGMAPCVCHLDSTPSLKIADGRDRIDLHCFAGCDWRDIKDTLRARGFLAEDDHRAQTGRRDMPQTPPEPSKEQIAHRDHAITIWRASTPGGLAETYLRARGISLPIPPSLRFHEGLVHKPTGLNLPTMIAAVQAPDRHIVGIHRTFLTTDGRRKAGVSEPKMGLGSYGRGAVRLGPAAETIGIAEGIETGLSASEMFGITVWVALGSRLHRIELPEVVRKVIVFADNGDAGHRAAERAQDAFRSAGRAVAVEYPPPQDADWNDTHRARRNAA